MPVPCLRGAMSIVTFDATEFKAIYPAFTDAVDAALETAFSNAELLIDNTVNSPIPVGRRKRILHLAVAHLADLAGRGGGGVGNVASAAQGSTSVSFSFAGQADKEGFWSQTSYGLLLWKALRPWRTAFYVTACPCGKERA